MGVTIRKRNLYWNAVWFLLLGSATFFAHAQPPLLVCVPGAPNIYEVQKSFESVLGEGKIQAFARVKDLEASLAVSPDAAIIVPESFIQYTPGYTVLLSGKSLVGNGEKYIIVAPVSSMAPGDIATKRVGILDFLGREKLPLFVKDYFNLMIPQLKRANKIEDLQTMLGMETVDAIIVSSSGYKEIMGITKQSLFTVMESTKPVGGLVLAAKSGTDGSAVKSSIGKVPSSVNKEIGVEKWESQ